MKKHGYYRIFSVCASSRNASWSRTLQFQDLSVRTQPRGQSGVWNVLDGTSIRSRQRRGGGGGLTQQHENRLHALSKLRREIAYGLRDALPSAGGYELLPEPSVRNPRRLLWSAHVLDVLAACGWELKPAAVLLNTSVSRLTRTLYQDPDLWQILNRSRAGLGLHPLKGN